jgi:hypothetical protein
MWLRAIAADGTDWPFSFHRHRRELVAVAAELKPFRPFCAASVQDRRLTIPVQALTISFRNAISLASLPVAISASTSSTWVGASPKAEPIKRCGDGQRPSQSRNQIVPSGFTRQTLLLMRIVDAVLANGTLDSVLGACGL